MILNDDGKREFLNTKFHQCYNIPIEGIIQEKNIEQFVNFVIRLEEIEDKFIINDFLNEEKNNIVFTSENNDIYRYEYYNGVYFIRMYPFTSNLRLHIVPKKYDASNEKSNPVLFFRDDKASKDEDFPEMNWTPTPKYERDNNANPINSRYQEHQNEINEMGAYVFDIREHTRGMENLQINLGYSYNGTTPPSGKIVHYTGILDESDKNGNKINPSNFTEWNSALMDVNYDNMVNGTDNTVFAAKQELNPFNINPKHNVNFFNNNPTPYPNKNNGFSNPHSRDLEETYHKTIKYFNDDIYIEENNKFLTANWEE